MAASHDHSDQAQGTRLAAALGLVLATAILELAGGLLTHSLALLADFGHVAGGTSIAESTSTRSRARSGADAAAAGAAQEADPHPRPLSRSAGEGSQHGDPMGCAPRAPAERRAAGAPRKRGAARLPRAAERGAARLPRAAGRPGWRFRRGERGLRRSLRLPERLPWGRSPHREQDPPSRAGKETGGWAAPPSPRRAAEPPSTRARRERALVDGVTSRRQTDPVMAQTTSTPGTPSQTASARGLILVLVLT